MSIIVKITLSTTLYGNEVSWKIVDNNDQTICASLEVGSYDWHRVHPAEDCVIAPNDRRHSSITKYKLICEDSYGDGWHGGHLIIQGTSYCHDFTTGFTNGNGKDLTINGNFKI